MAQRNAQLNKLEEKTCNLFIHGFTMLPNPGTSIKSNSKRNLRLMRRRERTQMPSRSAHSAKHQRATSESIKCAQLANKHSIAAQIAKSMIGRRHIRFNAKSYRKICQRQNEVRSDEQEEVIKLVIGWLVLLIVNVLCSFIPINHFCNIQN